MKEWQDAVVTMINNQISGLKKRIGHQNDSTNHIINQLLHCSFCNKECDGREDPNHRAHVNKSFNLKGVEKNELLSKFN